MTEQTGAQPTGPLIRVLGQYIKDLSFENPASQNPASSPTAPNIDLGIDVNARPIADTEGLFESDLKISARATSNDEAVFIAELVYGGTFELKGIADKDIEPILLVECPRLLFPFARRLMAEVTREGGYPPLLIDPIDFVGLYQSQKAAARQQAEASQSTP